MSHRLQVLIPERLNERLARAAEREQTSKAEWVRRAIVSALRGQRVGPSPVDELDALNAPTADIDEMNRDILVGRSS